MKVQRAFGVAPALALVVLLASVNYLVGLGEPSHPVWDESYYLTSTQRYIDGTAQFASHPPLGLMLIAAGEALVGANRGLNANALAHDKEVRAERLPEGYSFAGVRLASGIFAVIGAMLFFALMRELTQRSLLALLASNLYIFDNALIAHFRAAHLDSFQVAFALCALLCFVIGARRSKRGVSWYDLGLGVACGLATMVKLNAGLLMLLGAMLIVRRAYFGWRERPVRALFRTATRDGAVMLAGWLLAIAAVFTIHVAVSPHAPDATSAAGAKDAPFVSSTYRAWLDGERRLTPDVVLAAALDYSRFMTADLHGMARTDANASRPLQWPLNDRTINYRWDSDGVRTSYVQLTGNAIGWALALLAPLAAVWLLFLQYWRPCVSTQPHRRDLMVMLLVMYAIFMAAHSYLATLRVMYLYHYFIGLLLAFCLVPLVCAEAADRWRAVRDRQGPFLVGATALLLASFVFYSPLTFHRPLTTSECQLRNALQSVVACI